MVLKERNRGRHIALDSSGKHPRLFRVYAERLFYNNNVRVRCVVQKYGHLLYTDDDLFLSNAGAKILEIK